MDLCDEFYNAMQELDNNDIKQKVENTIFADIRDDCVHENTIFINDSEVCTECGVVKDTVDKDIKYFFSTEKHVKDPSRCHRRKSDQRTIFKDVETMDFPETIVQSANKKYQVIIKDNIYRGAKRKAIIVACLYYAYLDHNESRTTEDISRKFNIKKKSVKEGLQKYCECFPEAATQYIDAKHLIRQVMIRVNINFSHLRRINKLCDYLENRSALLNRSNPQSVAAAIVYLYLCLNPEYKEQLGLKKDTFATEVNLSDITISKLSREIQKIIKDDDVRL